MSLTDGIPPYTYTRRDNKIGIVEDGSLTAVYASNINDLQIGVEDLSSGAYKGLFTGTANKASTTTAQTISLVPTGVGSMTLPASLFTVGRTVILRASGFLSTGATAGTLNWLYQIGGSTVVSTGTVAPTISLTNILWSLEVVATCRTVGTSGTVIAQGVARMPTSATAQAQWGMVETAASTVNTTVTRLVDLQLVTSNNLHTITTTNLELEFVN